MSGARAIPPEIHGTFQQKNGRKAGGSPPVASGNIHAGHDDPSAAREGNQDAERRERRSRSRQYA